MDGNGRFVTFWRSAFKSLFHYTTSIRLQIIQLYCMGMKKGALIFIKAIPLCLNTRVNKDKYDKSNLYKEM